MSVTTNPIALTVNTGVQIKYPAAAQYESVVLSNLSAFMLQVVISGDLYWLPPWTADQYRLQAQQSPITATPQLLAGTTVASGSSSALTATWYGTGETVPGTYPLSLTANAVTAAIAGAVTAAITGNVTTITPAHLLSSGTTPGPPGSTSTVAITPSANALAIEFTSISVSFQLAGDQSHANYGRGKLNNAESSYVVIDINPAVDTTYTLTVTDTTGGTAYWITERTNEYKTAVFGGADFNQSWPVPTRPSVPFLSLVQVAPAVAGNTALIPAPPIAPFTINQTYPRLWYLSLSSQQAAGGFATINDTATGLLNYFVIRTGQRLDISPVGGLMIPTTSALRLTVAGAAGQVDAVAHYDYAPIIN